MSGTMMTVFVTLSHGVEKVTNTVIIVPAITDKVTNTVIIVPDIT
jgi:hypothetical protein